MTTLRCYRKRDVWHGSAIKPSGCYGNAAGLGSIPAGFSAGGAVRIARYIPSVQQDAVSLASAFHLLRDAERSFAAAQLRRLWCDDGQRWPHAACRPRSSWR